MVAILESKQATQKVKKFIVETTEKTIPGEAVQAAKKALIDYLGVAIGGAHVTGPKIMFKYAESAAAKPDAGLICRGTKTSAELAALANGTAGHALDFDDTIPANVHYNLHPSVGIFPTVIALGEKYGLTGSQILTSYITGIEVQYRAGLSIGQYVQPTGGWHSTGILGTIGSVAAAANLLKLDGCQTQMAIGIAGSLAGGMVSNLDTDTKMMHAGNAARNGVISAELAKDGFRANPTILDGKFSFCYIFSGGKSQELGSQVDNLSKQWDIVKRGITYKPWPSCRATHGSIEAALNLGQRPGMDLNQVESIVCKSHPIIPVFASCHHPQTGYEGKFSVGYCVATALLTGQIVLEDFTDEKIKDPKRKALSDKLSFVHPPGWGVGTVDPKVELTVKLKNGREFSHLVVLPKGEPENPLTDEEILAKFRKCTSAALQENDADAVIDMAMHFDEVSDINRLTKIINAKAAKSG